MLCLDNYLEKTYQLLQILFQILYLAHLIACIMYYFFFFIKKNNFINNQPLNY